MDEETQVSQEQPVVESAPQTLDDVISTFNVQTQAPAEPNPSTVQEYTPAQPATPNIDPYDESSLNKWASDTANNQATLQQQVQELSSQISQRDKAEAQAKLDADIESAAKSLTKSLDGIDPIAAEILLEKEARTDPKFLQIWEARDKNPKALEAALSIISNKHEGKFQRVDPQIAENHRAAQQSQQSNQTATATEYNNSYEERLAGAKNESERQVIWAQIKNGG